MSEKDPRVGSGACAGNAAPYVLGALEEGEHEEFRAHLETCAVCREEVVALKVVANSLPALAPQLDAPPELKSRVMSSVRSEAALSSAREPAPARKGTWAREGTLARRRARLPLTPRRAGLALAGLAAIAAVLAVALLSGGGGSSERVIRAQVLAPRASASLHLRDGRAELQVSGMPQPAGNRVYEVWVKRAGGAQPTDALFTVGSGGRATVAVPGSIAGVKQVMVTAEPRGGSSSPTSAPVIIASIS
jgi:anti-sigma-K factor RskA